MWLPSWWDLFPSWRYFQPAVTHSRHVRAAVPWPHSRSARRDICVKQGTRHATNYHKHHVVSIRILTLFSLLRGTLEEGDFWEKPSHIFINLQENFVVPKELLPAWVWVWIEGMVSLFCGVGGFFSSAARLEQVCDKVAIIGPLLS